MARKLVLGWRLEVLESGVVDAKESESKLSGDTRDDCETAVETAVWDVVESASVCSFRLKFRLFFFFFLMLYFNS